MTTYDPNQQLFDAIVAEYSPLISKICYMYATDSEHFKDLYQESLINLWQGLDRFRGDSKVSSWLYRITLNTCVSNFRRNRKHSENLPLEAAVEIAGADDSHTEDVRMLYNLISRLDRLDKAIIMLWLDEKPYDEIAEITGLNKSNVGVRLNRIRKRLSSMTDIEN